MNSRIIFFGSEGVSFRANLSGSIVLLVVVLLTAFPAQALHEHSDEHLLENANVNFHQQVGNQHHVATSNLHHYKENQRNGFSQHREPSSSATADTTRQLSELEALYWQRLHDSRQNFVQADVDFMTDMIVHHAQALIMSRLSPQNGASAAVQRLSARIINAQQDEIALMQQWLRDRNQPVPIVHFAGLDMHVSMEMPEDVTHEAPGSQSDMHRGDDQSGSHSAHEGQHGHESHHGHENHNMHEMSHHDSGHKTHNDSSHSHSDMHHDHHGHNHDDMVGMLSQAQMEELAAARDSEFDRLFLTYMIEHHEGAVYMVNELFLADGAGTDLESYRLAVDIYAEQVTEIAMMRGMLDRKGFPVPDPLPELLEQQEQLRNPSAASQRDHHRNSQDHHQPDANSNTSSHHHHH